MNDSTRVLGDDTGTRAVDLVVPGPPRVARLSRTACRPGGPALRITSRGVQRSIVTSADLRPIHHVPPCGHVLSTTILILQVVGVLPHIETQDGHLDVHERAVLVGGRGDLYAATVNDK